MTLKLVRVDDRLIHGQVVAIWLKALGAKRIVIVDDKTAADEFLREILMLAAPPGVPVEVHDVAIGTERVRDFVSHPGSDLRDHAFPDHGTEVARGGR